MKSRSLITGGAGFIGSHLADELLRRGQEVDIIDNLSTGSIDNIEHLKQARGFRYFIDTVDNEPLLAELIDRCDTVYHLAAAVGVRLIVESPVNTIHINVHGTEIVLKHANKKKKRTIIASTSEVYGKSAQVPFREDQDLVLGPTFRGRWSYACSKALDEFLALAYWQEKKLPVIVVRLFNTVGPRQISRYGMVIPTFVRQALAGVPITVYGDGTQSRCFTHVSDVVTALVDLSGCPEAVGQVVNIGSSSEITINGLAHLVREVAGSDSEIVHIPYAEAYAEGFEDMARRVPDVSKLQRFTGYAPNVGITDTIRSVIDYYANRVQRTAAAVVPVGPEAPAVRPFAVGAMAEA